MSAFGSKRAILNSAYKPVAQWTFAGTNNVLPPWVNVSSPSLGGLVLDAAGYLTYCPNNLLLNSASLSTQNVTVGKPYNLILAFYGTGSITLSGAYAATVSGTGASNQVYVKFAAASAGTLTVTVSGSVTSATLSAVTYETTPRPQDQVITAASAYYGPKFDYEQGLRIWEQRTNFFLNSATGVTQNVTTSATTYTLSMYGTGSITLSGTGSGTLNGPGAFVAGLAPAALTFVATAGTLTLTVTGSCTYVNLEAAISAGPRIPTGSAAVVATADIVSFTGSVLGVLGGTSYSVLLETNSLIQIWGGENSYLIGTAVGNTVLWYYGSVFVGAPIAYANGTGLATPVAITWANKNRLGIATSPSGRTICANGGNNYASDGQPQGALSGTVYLFNGQSINHATNGYATSLAFYNNTLPKATLVSRCSVGARF